MNLETGRKTFVTVDELLALAVVFGVPVEDLLGVSDDDLSTESLARARDRKLNTAQRLTREAELLRTEAARLSGLVGTVR
jgi:transcriptional regulator with XRE-family HTH domain